MALLPPHYLDPVVALGRHADDGTMEWVATGFLFARDDDEGEGTWLFIVTNRHVADRPGLLYCRFNDNQAIVPLPVEGSSVTTPWITHPDPAVDVAVRMFDANTVVAMNDTDLPNFGATSLPPPEERVSAGDGVFVLGFPLGLAGDERNDVIVRQGIIARTPQPGEEVFLVDASIFPGNSGGPVFTKPEMFALPGTEPILGCGLIGMVSSYIPYEEVAISAQTGLPRMIFQENSGLAEIVPIVQVQQTVEIAYQAAMQVMKPAPPEAEDGE